MIIEPYPKLVALQVGGTLRALSLYYDYQLTHGDNDRGESSPPPSYFLSMQEIAIYYKNLDFRRQQQKSAICNVAYVEGTSQIYIIIFLYSNNLGSSGLLCVNDDIAPILHDLNVPLAVLSVADTFKLLNVPKSI